MRKGVWRKKGQLPQTGKWEWCWSSRRFSIHLDSKDPVTGRKRHIIVSGDSPNFNGWKLCQE